MHSNRPSDSKTNYELLNLQHTSEYGSTDKQLSRVGKENPTLYFYQNTIINHKGFKKKSTTTKQKSNYCKKR